MTALRDLGRRFGIEYPTGTWFMLSNFESGLVTSGEVFAPRKPDDEIRPYVLIRPAYNRAIVDSRPRSKTSPSGIEHSSHPPRHEASCGVNRPARVIAKLWPLSSDVLDSSHYSCIDPDEGFIAAITPRSS